MKFKKTLILCYLSLSAICAADESTYNLLAKEKKCTENSSSQQIDCEYKIGSDFWLVIAGIGLKDTGITFFKTDFNGKYYGSFGLLHGCVIVKTGRANKSNITNMAFISPKNGKIYTTWQQCQENF